MKDKKFKAYPQRHITLSDEVWEQLKAEKIKFGKNWNSFIKHLLYGDRPVDK